MNRAFALDDGALGIILILARVPLDHFDPFHDHTLLVPQDLNDAPALPALGASQDYDLIAFFDMKFLHNN